MVRLGKPNQKEKNTQFVTMSVNFLMESFLLFLIKEIENKIISGPSFLHVMGKPCPRWMSLPLRYTSRSGIIVLLCGGEAEIQFVD